MKLSETFLPGFSGFYGTHWEHMITLSEESDSQHLAEQETGGHALEADDFLEIYYEVSDYGKHNALLARRFCELFDAHISKKVGFSVGLKFEKLISPEYYNFTTDRVLAKIPAKSVSALYAASKASKHKSLKREIIAEYTSYDGFVSYYSNNLDDWLAKPVAEWDPNEYRSLLAAFVDPDVDQIVFDCFNEGEFYEAFEKSVNWKKFDKKVAEIRRQRA